MRAPPTGACAAAATRTTAAVSRHCEPTHIILPVTKLWLRQFLRRSRAWLIGGGVPKDGQDRGGREPIASPEAGRLGKRARLPALDALRVFESAARHLSFTRAAEELHVTQAAVSHRINALETELGLALFRRLNRRLELTEDGEGLVVGVREGLMRMVRAVAELDR